MNKKILITLGVLVIFVVLVCYELIPVYDTDKPLQENPQDLGNIHKPSIEELALEELHGIPRFNCWYNFVGKGSDEKLYAFHGTFAHDDFRYGKAWLTLKVFSEPEPTGFFTHPSLSWKRTFDGETIVYLASGENGCYFKYTIYRDTYLVESVIKADCQNINMKGHRNIFIRISFHRETSFWYNKGQIAKIYPDCVIAGIEETSKAEGYIIIDGERVDVSGLGHGEHFFNNGNIVPKIRQYGNEFWMPFRFDEVQGFFVVFGDYKDAGLLIDDEYIIPSSFDYFPDSKKRTVRVIADTPKGKLDVTYYLSGNIKAQNFGISTGKLDGKDLTNGFGWVEHIN
jgi:hypothetical protein